MEKEREHQKEKGEIMPKTKIINSPDCPETDIQVAEGVFWKKFKNWYSIKDDLIGDAILALQKVKNKFDASRGNYLAFANKVTFNAMLVHLRARKRPSRFGSNVSLDEMVPGTEGLTVKDIIACDLPNTEEMLLKAESDKEMKTDIKDALSTLPYLPRLVAILCLQKRYSQEKAAEKIGISRSQLNKMIRKIRIDLQEQLSHLGSV